MGNGNPAFVLGMLRKGGRGGQNKLWEEGVNGGLRGPWSRAASRTLAGAREGDWTAGRGKGGGLGRCGRRLIFAPGVWCMQQSSPAGRTRLHDSPRSPSSPPSLPAPAAAILPAPGHQAHLGAASGQRTPSWHRLQRPRRRRGAPAEHGRAGGAARRRTRVCARRGGCGPGLDVWRRRRAPGVGDARVDGGCGEADGEDCGVGVGGGVLLTSCVLGARRLKRLRGIRGGAAWASTAPALAVVTAAAGVLLCVRSS
jgi:hypothetical protein